MSEQYKCILDEAFKRFDIDKSNELDPAELT